MFKKIVGLLCILCCFHQAIALECEIAANSQECCAGMVFKPTSKEDIQTIIVEAKAQNKKVRCVAGLHGSIDAVCTTTGTENDLWFIDTEKLNNILEFNPDEMSVTAEAGVPLWTIGRELAKHGFEPIAFPGAYEITVGGMVANGVHSTERHGSWVVTSKE